MEVSKKGIDLIAEFEGFSPKPYLDPIDIPTIGYGTTFYLNNKKVTMFDPPINESEARKLLSIVANKFCQQLKEVTRTLNQNQFDAVASFVYNVGIGAYRKYTL
jgi:lysozyme